MSIRQVTINYKLINKLKIRRHTLEILNSMLLCSSNNFFCDMNHFRNKFLSIGRLNVKYSNPLPIKIIVFHQTMKFLK